VPPSQLSAARLGRQCAEDNCEGGTGVVEAGSRLEWASPKLDRALRVVSSRFEGQSGGNVMLDFGIAGAPRPGWSRSGKPPSSRALVIVGPI
jgi:hypothetical protein